MRTNRRQRITRSVYLGVIVLVCLLTLCPWTAMAEEHETTQPVAVEGATPAGSSDGEGSPEGQTSVPAGKNGNETGTAAEAPGQAQKTERAEHLEMSEHRAEEANTVQAARGAATEVTSFAELKAAIANAPAGAPVTIRITRSFALEETLTIESGKEITLVSVPGKTVDNTAIDGERWLVTNPSVYKNEGETRERQAVEEAKGQGERALAVTEERPATPEIALTRADGFTDTIFEVHGKLTIGTQNPDGTIEEDGLFIGPKSGETYTDVRADAAFVCARSGGNFIFNAGTFTGASGASAVQVTDGGTFTMNGGRISYNTTASSTSGVRVDHGGMFTMNGGSIDHNIGEYGGGLLVGAISANTTNVARAELLGGIIAHNEATGRLAFGGGIFAAGASDVKVMNGIIAGNTTVEVGGGIALYDQYNQHDGTTDGANIAVDPRTYEEYRKTSQTVMEIKGGLVYKNRATKSGGGIYVATNDLTLTETMLVGNISKEWGGGIYISYYPYKQTFVNTLVTANSGSRLHYTYPYAPGSAGGLWNCPVGNVTLEPGHSLYIYENGNDDVKEDIYTGAKTPKMINNKKYYLFDTTISPVTKEDNIIQFIREDIPDAMHKTDKEVALIAVYTDALKEEAWRNANVFIMENNAAKGGGIGSNADIYAPGKPGTHEIDVEKRWDDATKPIPDDTEVRIDLLIADKDYDMNDWQGYKNAKLFIAKIADVTLTKKNDWHARFTDLPYTKEELAKRGLKYIVRETKPGTYHTVAQENEGARQSFTVTNYPFSELPVMKKWDPAVKPADIPAELKVYLLRDGKRVKDEDGNDRFVILTKDGNWQGQFERLPYFGIEGMGLERYGLEEDSGNFSFVTKRRTGRTLNLMIKRDDLWPRYKFPDDYPGSFDGFDFIPIELHYQGQVVKTEIKKIYCDSPEEHGIKLYGAFQNLLIADDDGETIKIETYYDENGKPFPRNLGHYYDNDGNEYNNPGSYVFKLEKEGNDLVLKVPKLTGTETEENLFFIREPKWTSGKDYLELTNDNAPGHRLRIKKIWQLRQGGMTPDKLTVTVKDKDENEEKIDLIPDQWEYEDKKMRRGRFAARAYTFSEETLENFRGKMEIEVVPEFAAKGDKTVTYIDADGKTVTADEMKALLKGKDYTYRLVQAQAGKAEVRLVTRNGKNIVEYPIDVTVTEVATIVFTNREKPEKPPEKPPEEPPEKPPETPPETPPTPPVVPRIPRIPRAGIGRSAFANTLGE